MSVDARDFGRLEGKVDQLLEIHREDRTARADLEKRVRKVEGRLHWYAGVGATLGAVLGSVLPKPTTLL
jgi:hypothetical protein